MPIVKNNRGQTVVIGGRGDLGVGIILGDMDDQPIYSVGITQENAQRPFGTICPPATPPSNSVFLSFLDPESIDVFVLNLVTLKAMMKYGHGMVFKTNSPKIHKAKTKRVNPERSK